MNLKYFPLLMALGGACAQAAAPRLEAPAGITNGVVRLMARGTVGSAQVIELSTDLRSWVPLSVAAFTTGEVAWEFPAGEGTFHAYRLRSAASEEIPSPLKITTTVNSDFRRTTTVTSAGGSLKLTDDNGVSYQLVIPPNALLATEDITMRVVNDVTDWPLAGKYIGGVQLEPAGLRFLAPATLTITTPTPLASATALAWHDAGAELHAQPNKVTGSIATIPIGRLDGYGLATLLAGDLNVLATHPPTRLDEQSDLQLALVQLGAAAPAGRAALRPAAGPVPGDRVGQTYQLQLRPDLIAAADDDSRLDLALARYSLWRGSLDILFSPAELAALAPMFDEAIQLGGRAIYLAINRYADRCERHKITSLGKLVHFGQIMELAPWSASFTDADRRLFRQKVKNCATFDLDLDGTVEHTDKLGHGRSRVHTHWTIEFKDDALTQLTGEGPVPFDEVTFELTAGPPCFLQNIAPHQGAAQIPEFTLVPNLRDLASVTNRPPAQGMAVLINPYLSAPGEGIQVACPPGVVPPLEGFWVTGIGSAYHDVIKTIPRGQVFRISNWSDGSGDVLGEKSDTFTVIADGAITAQVRVKWSLRHAPVPFR